MQSKHSGIGGLRDTQAFTMMGCVRPSYSESQSMQKRCGEFEVTTESLLRLRKLVLDQAEKGSKELMLQQFVLLQLPCTAFVDTATILGPG